MKSDYRLEIDDNERRQLASSLRRLSRSKFRSSFHLRPADIVYIDRLGWDKIRNHAEDFVAQRLAPANIPNDGRQTPMRHHPVFIAQHATATCCRGCLAKWHHITPGVELTADQQWHIVNLIMAWLIWQYRQMWPSSQPETAERIRKAS